MRICILNVDNKHSVSAISALEPFADPAFCLNGHYWERYYIQKNNSLEQVRDLLLKKFDIFLNLCDGAEGEDRPGIEVVQLLEKENVAFTGAGSKFYDPSKEEMRIACDKAGVRFPRGVEVKSVLEIEHVVKGLGFPFIVKHPKSYNSIGLTKKSVVNNVQELNSQANIMINEYGGALIEEFIEGREFTALVVENADDRNKPVVFTPMEIVFPEGESFKHFDLKWKGHSNMGFVPCLESVIANEINRSCADMFVAMNGTGYGRCDMRMNKKGELFMLEINPNCSIYFPKEDCSSADQILFYAENGHQKFTDLILQAALLRQRGV